MDNGHEQNRSGPFGIVGQLILTIVFGACGALASQQPAGMTPGVDRAAVPELMHKGDWAGAQKLVDVLLASNPEDLEALSWQNDMKKIDSWPAVHVRNRVGYPGNIWLRLRWVGFDPDNAQREGAFQLPMGSLEVKFKEKTNWVQPGYGVVSHGVDIKSGTESFRVLTKVSFFETLTMESRIESMQIKSRQPFVPAPGLLASIRDKDATGVKEMLQDAVNKGRWDDADSAFQHLAGLFPQDPDLGKYREELEVIRKWPVRSWSSYAGTLYLRQNWITFAGEDYGSDPGKPLRNDSFHFPISALKDISAINQNDYGAKSGTGGLLDLVPGWASDVVTGKDWGFKLAFKGGEKKYSFYIRGAGATKESAKADIRQIESVAAPRR
jgi:hypothetical protein